MVRVAEHFEIDVVKSTYRCIKFIRMQEIKCLTLKTSRSTCLICVHAPGVAGHHRPNVDLYRSKNDPQKQQQQRRGIFIVFNVNNLARHVVLRCDFFSFYFPAKL